MTSIGRVFPSALILEIYCRNSYPVDGVKSTRAGPIGLAGYFLIEGRPWRALSRIECSHKVGVVVNVKGLNLNIYLSLRIWHSTSTTNFSSRELIE